MSTNMRGVGTPSLLPSQQELLGEYLYVMGVAYIEGVAPLQLDTCSLCGGCGLDRGCDTIKIRCTYAF